MANRFLRATSSPLELPALTGAITGSSLQIVLQKYWSELLIASAVLINILVAMSVTYFPYTDINNHLARYVLMHDALFSGISSEHVSIRLLPTAYIAIDLLGAVLVHFFAPETIAKILVLLYLTLLPLGAYRLTKAVCPQQRAFAVVAALLSFNWYFLLGFVNYGLGIALALLAMSWWWPRRATMNPKELLLFGLSCAGLYMVHMAAAALVLVAAGLEYGLFAYNALRTTTFQVRPHLFGARLAPALVATLSVAALLTTMKLTSTGVGQEMDPRYLIPTKKFSYLFSPFYSFSALQALIMTGSYAICAWLFLRLGRPETPLDRKSALPAIFVAGFFLLCIPLLGAPDGGAYFSFSMLRLLGLFVVCLTALGYCLWKFHADLGDDTLALLPPALLFIYFLFPVALFGGYYIDIRFLLPAYLLLFFVPINADRHTEIKFIACALWATTIVNAGVTSYFSHDIDRKLSDFRHVLTQIPNDKTVLTLIADHDQYGRIPPYRHFALWRISDHRGWAPGLFSGDMSGEQLGHFLVTTQLYYPNENWGTKMFWPAPDWYRITTDYQYLIQAGDDPLIEALLSKYATPVYRLGEIGLYRVDYRAARSTPWRKNTEASSQHMPK